MTSTLERLARPTTKGASVLIPTLAQVDLLPPEIRAKRGFAKVKRLLAFVLVVVLGAVAFVYAAALVGLTAANQHLSHAQDDTAALTVEQQKYAEVPQVLDRVSALEDARRLGFSTEVTWTPYLGAIFAVMPANVQLSSIEVTGATPMLSAAPPTDVLQAASVETITFSGRSTTLIDTAGWIDALNAIPGFSDAWVSAVTVTEGESRDIYYSVSSSVQVTDAAFANRFAEEGN
jgi:Tfp pilus assembly protein PilN